MNRIGVAEIVAIGSELLTPLRNDTNSLYLTQKLNELGVVVRRKTVVGDDVEDLARVVSEASQRADLLILMGGLGPTEDDRTREAVSAATGRKLVRDEGWVQWICDRFARAGRVLAENNLQQADLIDGAELLPNTIGTAAGQWIAGPCAIALLPGPPRELRTMFEKECLPRIRPMAAGTPITTRILRITGLTESFTDSLVGPIYRDLKNPVVTILSSPGSIELHLRAIDEGGRTAADLIAGVEELFRAKLGDHVYGTGDENLETVVSRQLLSLGKTIACAESCTGGLLATRLTDISGSSGYFLRGYVSYSNQAKIDDLGVPACLVESHGAVSSQVAEAMASGARSRATADIGVGITGIAGPTGGTETKPVGLVYISVSVGERIETSENRFMGGRSIVRFQATQKALDMVRMMLKSGVVE